MIVEAQGVDDRWLRAVEQERSRASFLTDLLFPQGQAPSAAGIDAQRAEGASSSQKPIDNRTRRTLDQGVRIAQRGRLTNQRLLRRP
jgi:hypothetical protein